MRFLLRLWVVSYHHTKQLLRYALGRLRILFVRDGARRERLTGTLRGSCVADLCRSLGPTFIKVGQILSSRPDMLSPPVIDELRQLQDQLPPFAFEHVERILQEDFGRSAGELFAEFDAEPVAAASVAQVHRARLREGDEVAVKIVRPGIDRVVAEDILVMGRLARLVELFPLMKKLAFRGQVDEFGGAIQRQLDLTLEARNNQRFQYNFKDLPWVRLPKLYASLCSERVLTMEFVRGKKIDEVAAHPPIPGPEMAKRLFRVYIKMAFEDLFIHADMHPGNILVDPEGSFIFLDVGLIAEVPDWYIATHLKLNLAMVQYDARKLCDLYFKTYNVVVDDYETAVADAQAFLDRFRDRAISEVEFGDFIFQLFSLMRRYGVPLDPVVTLLNVAYATFEGMGKMFDPNLDVVPLVMAQLPKIVRDRGLTF